MEDCLTRWLNFDNWRKPTCEMVSLTIGYVNAIISALFVIGSVSIVASWRPDPLIYREGPMFRDLYRTFNDVGPFVILLGSLLCMCFAVYLIYGIHKGQTKPMHVYLVFGVISIVLSAGVVAILLMILAFIGDVSRLFTMLQITQIYGFFAVELYIIYKTMKKMQAVLPLHTNNTEEKKLMKDEKDTSLPPPYVSTATEAANI